MRVLTAGDSFPAGARVRVGDDGLAYADADGRLEAWSSGEPGYCVTVGPVRGPMGDTPTRIVRVGRDGAELGASDERWK